MLKLYIYLSLFHFQSFFVTHQTSSKFKIISNLQNFQKFVLILEYRSQTIQISTVFPEYRFQNKKYRFPLCLFAQQQMLRLLCHKVSVFFWDLSFVRTELDSYCSGSACPSQLRFVICKQQILSQAQELW